MEKDGVVETRVEQKITIQSDGDPIDHDRALADAIQEATMMNPDMTVEKIEIQQQSTLQWKQKALWNSNDEKEYYLFPKTTKKKRKENYDQFILLFLFYYFYSG